MTEFDAALSLVLKSEGGKVQNRADPGGRTNYGVTQRTYDAWRKAKGLLPRDVWLITQADVTDIYRNAYAAPMRFDELPAGVNYAVFDEVVNEGVNGGITALQRALGIPADGVVGAVTMAAAFRIAPAVLINRLCDQRLGFLRRLRAWLTFGRGWSARVAFVRENALRLAKPIVTTTVVMETTPGLKS